MMARNRNLVRRSQPRLWPERGQTAAIQAVGAYQFCALIGQSRVLWSCVQTLAHNLQALLERLVRAGIRVARVCPSAQTTVAHVGQAALPAGHQELHFA